VQLDLAPVPGPVVQPVVELRVQDDVVVAGAVADHEPCVAADRHCSEASSADLTKLMVTEVPVGYSSWLIC
jgi:hypothetical protein